MGRKRVQESQDLILDEMLQGLIDNEDPQVFVGDRSAELLITLQLPSFALRYLFQQEGLPLNRIIGIVGEPESCKSSFLYELMRIFRLNNGVSVYLDTECKSTHELLYAIMNYDTKSCLIQRCSTLEGWLSASIKAMNYFREKFSSCRDDEIRPVAVAVDSLTSCLEEKEFKRWTDETEPERRFPAQAYYISEYMRYMSKQILDYPMAFFFVNHLKKAVSSIPGVVERRLAGGAAVRFHESIEIEMVRKHSGFSKAQTTRVVDGRKFNCIEVELIIRKNSTAPHAKIGVDFLSAIDPERMVDVPGFPMKVPAQIVYFDWPSATAELFIEYLSDRHHRERIYECLGEIQFDESRRLCTWSDEGLEREPYKVFSETLEAKLDKNESVKTEIYKIFGIRRRVLYRPGTSYRALVEWVQEQKKQLAIEENSKDLSRLRAEEKS
jgi:RecA/RadA recombinase